MVGTFEFPWAILFLSMSGFLEILERFSIVWHVSIAALWVAARSASTTDAERSRLAFDIEACIPRERGDLGLAKIDAEKPLPDSFVFDVSSVSCLINERIIPAVKG